MGRRAATTGWVLAILLAGSAALQIRTAPRPVPGPGLPAPGPDAIRLLGEVSSTVLGDDPTPFTPLPAPAEPGPPGPRPTEPAREPAPPDRSGAEPSRVMGPEALGATTAAAPVTCSGLAVEARAEPASVAPGNEFTWTLTITNPNPKPLSRVSVTDTVSATSGMAWHVIYTDPVADSETDSKIAFDNLGPLGPGSSEMVRIRVRVDPESSGGRFTDEVMAAGDCETGDRVEGTAGVEGHTTLDLPEVTSVLGATARRGAAAASQASGPGTAQT